MNGRYNLMRGNPLFDAFLEDSPWWRWLFDELNREEFALRLAELFKPEIERKAEILAPDRFEFVDWFERPGPDSTTEAREPPPLPRGADENALYLNVDIARAEPGYCRGPHTDARHKVAVMLVFFSDHPPAEGGQFRLYEYPGDATDAPRSLPEDEVALAREVAPRANTALLFANSQAAYHAVTEFRRLHGLREFLYVSVASTAQIDVWGAP